jgi:hypothetical protein
MTKPTLLLLHGSWHSNQTWERLLPLLDGKGYKTIAPQVCFCGTEEPLTSIAPCIAQIQAIIAEETSAGRDVVMINHSFGGVVGCSSVNGFTAKNQSRLAGSGGKVIGIIQMCALTIPSNTSLLQFLGGGRSSIDPIAVAGPDGWDVIVKDVVDVMYNDMEPEDARHWAGRLVKHSSATRASSQGVYAGWKDVPVWYIFCTKDQAAPIAAQEKMINLIRENNPSLTVRNLDASHSPMLSRPAETADIIDEAATAFASVS